MPKAKKSHIIKIIFENNLHYAFYKLESQHLVKRIESKVLKDNICACTFIPVLLTIVKRRKQIKCPLTLDKV